MKRPLGVTVISVLLLAASVGTLARMSTHPGLRPGSRFLTVSALLTLLALVAAEALWRLRPHAFMAFTVWAVCAMVGLVMTRLSVAPSGHVLRVFGPILYAGLAYIVVAIYLRRAL